MHCVGWLDKYQREDGMVFLTGMQALVRLLIDKQRHDITSGEQVNQTFITGYEGSPLGGFDLEVLAHLDMLNRRGRTIHQFGINEKTAASAILGSQYARSGDIDAFWYGKAHGSQWIPDETWLANLAGTGRRGSMVLLCGEDHRSKSSVSPGSSDWALRSSLVPTFYPASITDILRLGMHAIHLSRWLGVVTAMKLVTPLCDGASSVDLAAASVEPVLPQTYDKSFHPIVMALGALPMQRELVERKIPLVEAYLRSNELHRVHWSGSGVGSRSGAGRSIGIVCSGKSFVDVQQALRLLGVRVPTLQLMVNWPLDRHALRAFADNHALETVFVIEEPGPFIEEGVKAALLGSETVCSVLGERDESGAPWIPSYGEVDPEILAQRLWPRLRSISAQVAITGAGPDPGSGPNAGADVRVDGGACVGDTALAHLARIESRQLPSVPRVTPMSCGGCPYNTFRDLQGEKPGGAIGCSSIRATPAYDQGVLYIPTMGAGGSIYAGTAPFNGNQHIFQYLGDGSYFHSGRGAIQSCVQGGVNITFLLLYNGTVALTGGQRPGGQRSVEEVADELRALGIVMVGIVSDTPRRLRSDAKLRLYPLREHGRALNDFRALAGPTVLILDKECATEKSRRHRRQGVTPDRYIFIDEDVCEGCGDCYKQSEGCAALYGVPTQFGDKTQVRQSSCVQDALCIDGECPAFVSVVPATGVGLRRRQPPEILRDLPEPPQIDLFGDDHRFTLFAVGRGGTGVITVSHVLAYAAMRDGLRVYLANSTGLAQKGGLVETPIQFSDHDQPVFHRLVPGSADLYLGFDLLCAADPSNLRYVDAERAVAIISTTRLPTAEQNRHPLRPQPETDALRILIDSCSRKQDNLYLDTYGLAERLFGDTLFANVILLGAAYQQGRLPMSAAAIEEALQVNGKQVEANFQAFAWGRLTVADPDRLQRILSPDSSSDVSAITASRIRSEKSSAGWLQDKDLLGLGLDEDDTRIVAERLARLVAYQDIDYARRYLETLQRVRQREGHDPQARCLTMVVAHSLYQLMAYKDEYEIARMISHGEGGEQIAARFDGAVRLERHLHPPLLRRLGRGKVRLGPWLRPLMSVLYRLRWLRGRAADPFGHSPCRHLERQLIDWYEGLVTQLLDAYPEVGPTPCAEIASLAQGIRGYEDVKITAATKVQCQVEVALAQLSSSS